MKKLLILLLLVLPLAGMVGCGTDRVVTPIYTGPPKDFGITAVLDKAVDPGSRVFISGSIVSASKPDSLVQFGTVSSDGVTVIGTYTRMVNPNDTNFFMVLWVEGSGGNITRSLSPLKVGGVTSTAIKANRWGIWWEFGLVWSADGPSVTTLRDDRSRLVDITVDYVGNTTMGETVSEAVPVRCKSTWSGFGRLSNPWGVYNAYPTPRYRWTMKALKPLPGAQPDTLYFRVEDQVKQRFYGCLAGPTGTELKCFFNAGSPTQPWLLFDARIDCNGNILNPRDRDERGGSINVTPGK